VTFQSAGGSLVVAAIACVLAFATLYGRWFYDPCVFRQIRAGLVETLGWTDLVQYDVELREVSVWTSQNGLERAFPWRAANAV
jgi:hypothetical protein